MRVSGKTEIGRLAKSEKTMTFMRRGEDMMVWRCGRVEWELFEGLVLADIVLTNSGIPLCKLTRDPASRGHTCPFGLPSLGLGGHPVLSNCPLPMGCSSMSALIVDY